MTFNEGIECVYKISMSVNILQLAQLLAVGLLKNVTGKWQNHLYTVIARSIPAKTEPIMHTKSNVYISTQSSVWLSVESSSYELNIIITGVKCWNLQAFDGVYCYYFSIFYAKSPGSINC